VQDDAGWFVPPDAAPGMYRLGIVVYNPATGEELMTRKDTQLEIGTLGVTAKK
jgi:hypothetical protein